MNRLPRQDKEECGACFDSTIGVVQERLADRNEALQRYARLFTDALAPALCQRVDGGYSVCHCPAPGSGSDD